MRRTYRQYALLLSAMLWCAASAGAEPAIVVTALPPYGADGSLRGLVSGVDFATHRVAAYIQVPGSGWWSKPTGENRTVPINPDGSFTAHVTTGGLDDQATCYFVAVVPAGYQPPVAFGATSVPASLRALAVAAQERYGRTIQFAGRTWGVKEARYPVGPGPNPFSASSNDVWVDGAGLHLTIRQRDGVWWSSEVVLLEQLGYGTYCFQTNSRTDILDADAVLGAFTYDSYGDDRTIPAWPHREIDFEDARWGDPSSSTNAQMVVQPHAVVGNLRRYTIPDLSDDAALTRLFTWEPGRINFVALRGHHLPQGYPPEQIIDQWLYTHDPRVGRVVPPQGRENFRLNLWLSGPNPASGQPIEVVVNDFIFTPAPHTLMWDAGRNGSWTEAAWHGPQPLPDATTAVVVDTAYTVTLAAAGQARWVAVSRGGTVQLASGGSLSVAESVTVGSGGTLRLSPGAVLNTSVIHLCDGTLDGAGALSSPVWVAGGRLCVPDPADVLVLAAPLHVAGLLLKAGSGTLVVVGGNQQSAAVTVNGGALRYELAGGKPVEIGADAVLTISGAATVQLAGNQAALGNDVRQVDIWNDSPVGLQVLEGNQLVGSIWGNGATAVAAGATLTANCIFQDMLAIGGTAGNPGAVVIGTSTASGSLLHVGAATNSAAVPEPPTASLFFMCGAMALVFMLAHDRGRIGA